MKKIVLMILGVVLLNVAVHAQILKPISWDFTYAKLKPGIFELHLKATIKPGWNIYSQWTPVDGPEPTVISFTKNSNVLFGGKAKEQGILKKKHEEIFGVDVHYFESTVDFVQVIKLKKARPEVVKGRIRYMTCDKDQCINDEIEFNIPVK